MPITFKPYNIRLHNPVDNAYVTYFTILFCNVSDFDTYCDGQHSPSNVPTTLPPLLVEDWITRYTDLLEQIGMDPDLLNYAKPIVTGMTDISDVDVIQQVVAHTFGQTTPFIYNPFNPWRAGDDHNDVLIGNRVYFWKGSTGTNAAGTYKKASSLYCYYNWPSTASESDLIEVQGGFTALNDTCNNIVKNKYIILACTDLDTPFETITPERYAVLEIGVAETTYPNLTYPLVRVSGQNAYAASSNPYKFAAAVSGVPEADREPALSSKDPYNPGGTSEPGGGTGNFDLSSDTIGVPALPTLSAVDTGLVSAFAPDAGMARDLARYLWDMNVDWTAVKKVISDPINTIFGFSILPYTPDTGTNKIVKLGSQSTGVSMPPVTNQYKEIDCGTLNVNEFWGSYLDYSPYTKTSLYLPYIGIVPVDIDDIMGKQMQVVYHCDCISGACIAYVLSNGSQIASYAGQVSSNVPISARDFTNTINGILGIAGGIAGIAVSGGASAPTAIPGIAANAINMLKPNVQKSGALSGTGGIMGTQFPFLIAQRPRQCLPASFNEFGGYPSYITETLGSLSGYTKVAEIHLSIPEATDAERDEIVAALKEGVII